MNKIIEQLFIEYFGEAPELYDELPEHASQRKLYRITSKNKRCIGVVYDNLPENRAFLGFSKTFQSIGLPVPEIYQVAENQLCYLEEDLGDVTLYSFLQNERNHGYEFSATTEDYYQQALKWLVQFQVQGHKKIDFNLCYQSRVFDSTAMQSDILAYQTDFLNVSKIQHAEQRLVSEAQEFISFLASASTNFFMYRDFQARNIMLTSGGLYFIDYQTGRHGPAQYDVVSLLYQAQARVPDEAKIRLLKYYVSELNSVAGVQANEFMQYFYGFVALRLMQVLATYGREGLVNRKEYFLKGIPIAKQSLAQVVEQHRVFNKYPELKKVTSQI